MDWDAIESEKFSDCRRLNDCGLCGSLETATFSHYDADGGEVYLCPDCQDSDDPGANVGG
jgi:hypothetical protein